MRTRPQIALLEDGRLHLQDGPIDLVIGASGTEPAVRRAYRAAAARMETILDELCAELPLLRAPARPGLCPLRGTVARRMHWAVAPYAPVHFITPMAAVAGAGAGEGLGGMLKVGGLDRAYVNNGGDIALHLGPGATFAIGMVDDPERPGLFGNIRISAGHGIGGIATSGWRGRSFSLGIADAVTVLARTATAADAAATIIANAVDLPFHPAVLRVPARDIQPDNDLGDRPVTRAVGHLDPDEIDAALAAGTACAERLVAGGLILGAALHLQGVTETAGIAPLAFPIPAQPMDHAHA